ncbi:MAG: stearoyl-CoA 9-desaturase [Planctomycetota bacterium]|nr:MAG: stearoyl-CoA 9-desaturase [Planctomycetota bacterium]
MSNPNRLNLVLVLIVSALAVFLLWLGSAAESWLAIAMVGVAFSFVMLTNYALLHEATHNRLHDNSKANYALGVLSGVWFPVPFTMIHVTHQGHHLRNRTDHEMFDLYYPTDNRLVRYVQWYGILCGFFWPFVPLGGLIAAISPALLRTRPFRAARSSNYLLGDVAAANVWRIRGEVALTVAMFTTLFWTFELKWLNTLVLYGCFSVNWSTRQYVGHAFTRRDIVEGAWNLRHNRLMSWILLHGEYDLNHHRRPDVSWLHLPKLTRPDDERPSYVRQYWRQWLGPRPATEPPPEAVGPLPLAAHSLPLADGPSAEPPGGR